MAVIEAVSEESGSSTCHIVTEFQLQSSVM